MRTQAQNFVQGEPFGAAVGLAGALGQLWVLFQHTAKMGLRDGDQILGDFPRGEEAQLFAPILVHSPRGQVITARRTCLSNAREAVCCDWPLQSSKCLVRVNVEIWRLLCLNVFGHDVSHVA